MCGMEEKEYGFFISIIVRTNKELQGRL